MIGLIIGISSIIAWLIWSNAFYQVSEGMALIRWGYGGDKVYFRGSFFAYPILHRVEKINLKEQRVLISLTNKENACTKDQIRVDVQLTFFVQVRHTNWDVLHIVNTFGGENAVNKEILSQVFELTFVETIKEQMKYYTYDALHQNPKHFVASLKQHLEIDYGGYQLNRIKIAALKYMPLDEYDIDYSASDAEGYKNLKEWLEKNKKTS